jgi:hypothetical protein
LKKLLAVLGAAGAVTFGGLAMGSPAFAAPAQNVTAHCNAADPTCGFNPVLTGPAPPFVTVSPNCPAFISTDDWAVNFTDGNSINHFTTNTNGDWGTGTATGPAVFTTSDGTVQYTGQSTEWFGGGNNAAGQSYQSFTVHFNGRGPAGKIQIQAVTHMTTNNAGTPTANVVNANVRCS